MEGIRNKAYDVHTGKNNDRRAEIEVFDTTGKTVMTLRIVLLSHKKTHDILALWSCIFTFHEFVKNTTGMSYLLQQVRLELHFELHLIFSFTQRHLIV